MTIHKTGNCGIAMHINQDDLIELGLTWEEFDDKAAKQWVKNALTIIGEPEKEPVSIDAFQNNSGILIFAILPSRPTMFAFDSFETLLKATEIPQNGNSDLYFINERYILCLYGEANLHWNEFAGSHEFNISFLREHGKLLLEKNALAQLKSIFKPA